MSFKDVLGHSKPIEMLQRAIQRDKVVHSYLFVGNEGIGKKWVALQFAKALNCLEEGDRKGMPAIIVLLAKRSITVFIPMSPSWNRRAKRSKWIRSDRYRKN